MASDNVVTLAGKPAGMSEDAAAALRAECERAIAEGAHVLLMVTYAAGNRTGCRSFVAHADASNIPLSTFYRDAYVVAHSLMMAGEDEGWK